MDLEEFRLARSMTYAQLADFLGLSQAKTAQRYALGEHWPHVLPLQVILQRAKGVTLDAMHRRRMAFLRSSERRVAA